MLIAVFEACCPARQLDLVHGFNLLKGRPGHWLQEVVGQLRTFNDFFSKKEIARMEEEVAVATR